MKKRKSVAAAAARQSHLRSSRLPSKRNRASAVSVKSAQGSRLSVHERVKNRHMKMALRSDDVAKHGAAAASPSRSTRLHKTAQCRTKDASPPADRTANPPTNSSPPPASDSSDSGHTMQAKKLFHVDSNGTNMIDNPKPSIECAADFLLMLAQVAENPTIRSSPLSFSCIHTGRCTEEKPDAHSAKKDVELVEKYPRLANPNKPSMPDCANAKENAVECDDRAIRMTSVKSSECGRSLSFTSLETEESDGASSSQDKDDAFPRQQDDASSPSQDTGRSSSFQDKDDNGSSSKNENDGSSNQDKLGASKSHERIDGSSLITILGCELELEYARAAQIIIAKHGDILANCLLEGSLRSHLLRSASSIYMELERLNFTVITLAELDTLQTDVHDLEKAKVDISWLANRLDDIRSAKLMEECNPLSNMEEQLMQNQKNIKELLKQLSLQKAKFEGIKSKLEAEKTQTAAIHETLFEVKEKVLPYFGKSLVDGI